MNSLVLLGNINDRYKILVNKSNSQNKLLEFTLRVQKPFKNKKGIVDNDFLKVKIWSNSIKDVDYDLAEEELILVKGRIGSFPYTNKNGDQNYYPEIIAEKLVNVSTMA